MNTFEKCPRCGDLVMAGALDAHLADPGSCQGSRPVGGALMAAPSSRGWGLAYLVSFFLPFVGFPFGLYLYAREDPEARGAGTTCVLLAFLGMMLAAFGYWQLLH